MQGQGLLIHYDGETLRVPPGLTVLSALEEAGVRLIRGVGCRGGVCGACTILFRVRGEPELHAGLMCQQLVVEGMEIMPLPGFPQKKVRHDLVLVEGEAAAFRVVQLYPEVNRCIMCGECSRICPMGIDVMSFVGMIKRGDLKGAARASFTCIQCQACALRCPSRISQPNAALAARRYHGAHEAPRAEHLTRAVERVEQKAYHAEFLRLMRMGTDKLRVLYQRREREPDDAPPGTWMPEDGGLL